MNAIKEIIEKASKLNGTVVLPEGMDPRVVTAACACVDRKICTPVVLGTAEEIAAAEEKAGLRLADRGIKTIDYTQGDAELENAYLEAWNAKESKKPAEKQKIIDLAGAQKTLRTKRIYFGGMMATAEQLVDIGLATAQTYRDLTGKEPKVAYLSFSTKGSAAGPLVEKVQKAVELAKPRFAEAGIKMDGELQFDAAVVPATGKQKNPNGAVQGDANVFIFPDLNAGNIGYKIAQRLGGADAIGPNLQGLAKAMNDLSRGCSAEDIVGTICVTLLQSTTK